jgi:hypothetical protein
MDQVILDNGPSIIREPDNEGDNVDIDVKTLSAQESVSFGSKKRDDGGTRGESESVIFKQTCGESDDGHV